MFVKVDKQLHFLWSFFFATLIGWFAVIFGVGKEVYDYTMDRKDFRAWRWKDAVTDLLFDTAGVIIGMGVRLWLKQ